MTYTIDFFYKPESNAPFRANVAIFFGEVLPYWVTSKHEIWGHNLSKSYLLKEDGKYYIRGEVVEQSWAQAEDEAQEALNKAIAYLAEAKAEYDANLEAMPATREGFIKIA